MIDPHSYLAFVVAVTLIELTPGPNMTYLAILAATRGRSAGFAAVAGVALGLAIVGILSALGLAAIVAGSRVLWEMLRWAGVLYLLWLAYEGWRGADDSADTFAGNGDDLYGLFVRGMVTNLLNPKAYVFYVAVLPQFSTAEDSLARVLALTATYVAVATIIHGAIVAAASEAQRFLTEGAALVTLRRVLSVLLGLVALWLAWETRR